MNDWAPPPSSLSPGGVRIAALLLGAIEAPHEASSQLARVSEMTWKWSVFSLLLVFRVRLADPVHLSSTGRDVITHLVHALGARVVRGTAIVGDHTMVLPVSHPSPD